MHPRIPTLLCLTLSLPCAAWDVRTDSEGDVVRWAKPLQMVLDARVGAQLGEPGAEKAIRAAFQNLDEATPYLEVSVTVGEGKPLGYVVGAADNQNSILALEDWPYSEGALAVTLVTLNARTNELLDADLAFNIEKHHFRVLPDSVKDERRYDDVQNTITHELGHVLGLMHNNATEDLVMYPSAPPGELIKRSLKIDDRDGLLSLYGTAPEPKAGPLQVGCSTTSSSPGWLAVALVFFLLLRPRKAAVLAAIVPAFALAAEPPAVTRADEVALVQVIARQSSQHPTNPGLIITELTLAPGECLKGACGAFARVLVAGGRVGDLEQIAVHVPVPNPGQRIIVTLTDGRARVLWVEPDAQALLMAALRASAGLPSPQGAAQPPRGASQVPAIRP